MVKESAAVAAKTPHTVIKFNFIIILFFLGQFRAAYVRFSWFPIQTVRNSHPLKVNSAMRIEAPTMLTQEISVLVLKMRVPPIILSILNIRG